MAESSVIEEVIRHICSSAGEGFVSHMYLDTVSYVTVGYGIMLPDADSAAEVPFMHPATKKAATAEEIRVEWKKIQDLSPNKTKINLKFSSYLKHTSLRIDEATGKELLKAKLIIFEAELNSIFEDFSTFPNSAQIGLFDMIYNLGKSGIVDKFPKFTSYVKNQNWEEAAKQSHRPQISAARNKYVADLFLSCVAGHSRAADRAIMHKHPVLRRGMKGEAVTKLQRQLNKISKIKYWGQVSEDGDFGKRTEDLVKKVQIFGGLRADGWVGTRTSRLLVQLGA